MPSINVDLDFLTHPKVLRLKYLFNDDPNVEMMLIRLWIWVGKYHAEDGVLIDYEDSEIEHILGWKGEPGKFLQALLRLKFLDNVEGGGYAVHDWNDHASHIARFKKQGKLMKQAQLAKNREGSKSASFPVNGLDRDVDNSKNAASDTPHNVLQAQDEAQGQAQDEAQGQAQDEALPEHSKAEQSISKHFSTAQSSTAQSRDG